MQLAPVRRERHLQKGLRARRKQQEKNMDDNDFDGFADLLEKELNSGFSRNVLDHAMNPRNVGRVEDENGFVAYTGPCGDTMMISIKVSEGAIEDARFWTDGCGTSIATGSMVTELAKGKPLDEAMMIGKREVLEALDGLPEESEHCALLAATTMQMAIEDYRGTGPGREYGR